MYDKKGHKEKQQQLTVTEVLLRYKHCAEFLHSAPQELHLQDF